MGEFNSDDHYIYYCEQESLKRNGVAYQGPAPAGSRDSLRRTASTNREIKGERKKLDLPWFTKKANKAPDTQLALFMEAAGALWVGGGRRMPSSW